MQLIGKGALKFDFSGWYLLRIAANNHEDGTATPIPVELTGNFHDSFINGPIEFCEF